MSAPRRRRLTAGPPDCDHGCASAGRIADRLPHHHFFRGSGHLPLRFCGVANLLGQFVRTRPRLIIGMVAGLAVGVALPWQWGPMTRTLIGWNVAVWLYLVLVGWLMIRSSHVEIRRLAEREDRSAVVVLSIMSVASIVSLAAIVLELSTAKDLSLGHRLAHYGFTAATVFGSWCLVGTLFTLHYARIYYQSPADRRALRFPDGETSPDYWDFLYFSFTIAVAAQTSDISVMSRSLRKTVLAQSILSFLFNAAIIGLSINIAASLVGS
jgi:uncharacterized membrane protein